MMPGIQEMLERVAKVSMQSLQHRSKPWTPNTYVAPGVCREEVGRCSCICLRILQEKNLDWEGFFERLKKNGQWHVEVY